MTNVRIAVDIGGTFTDGVAVETDSGTIWIEKVLTTPDDPGRAVSAIVSGLVGKVAAAKGATSGRPVVAEVVHGTTLVTNALIERKGARTALVVTRGTRDTLEIRRELRYDLYDLGFRLPEPLVAPDDRHEVHERMDAGGGIVRPLDAGEIEDILARLEAQDIRTVGICFLHAYANDAHERAVGEILKARRPGMFVSESAATAREMREFERMSTVAASAYVKPLVHDYLAGLEQRLTALGLTAPLRVMLSSGGFTSSGAAAETPILLLESGPAGGVLSAVNTGLGAGMDNVLAFDMGGTTAKVCVVQNGKADTTASFECGRVHRFKRGSGLPLLVKSVDLLEIGAGGGSIARVSELGLLAVGPDSAGAVPGPVAYARGGTEPTVTDADLWLGYLDPDRFLGGAMRLDRDGAGRALARLGEALGMGTDEVAFGIHNLVNETMAAAARVHVAEKGLDPRDFALVATGGAGPVHAVEIARKLGLKRVLCVPAAGAGSCLGFLAAPVRIDRTFVHNRRAPDMDWEEVIAAIAALRNDAEDEIRRAGGDPAGTIFEMEVEMRYAGQGNTVTVTKPLEALAPGMTDELVEGFEAEYGRLFGRTVPDGVAETVAWRLVAREPLRVTRFARADAAPEAGSGAPRTRRIWRTDTGGFGEAAVHARADLAAGNRLEGPLVVEEAESTLVVPLGARVTILEDLTILVEL